VLRHRRRQPVPRGADLNLYSLDEALRFRPKIAVIANPAPFHLRTAMPLARQGCHLLIEKPLATNLAEAKVFLKKVEKCKVVCQVGYNLRFLPSLVKFRQIIQGGGVGRPFSVHCEVGQHLPNWRPGTDYRDGVSAKKKLGGGVLLELSHDLDYVRWIFGEPTDVSARIEKISDLEIDVEDRVDIRLKFRRKKSAKFVLGNLIIDCIRRDKTRQCLVIGTRGTLLWDCVKGIVKIYKASTKKWKILCDQKSDTNKSYKLQWENFIKNIKNHYYSFHSLKDSVRVLDMIEKIKKDI
jgi:predicted dehydrogenase